jgi:cysteine-rich repeat protein
LWVVLLGACGNEIERCGNQRIEGAEQCDDGNSNNDDGCRNDCRLTALVQTTVRWTLIGEQYPGFSETCSGVGATTAVVTLTGPMPRTDRLECQNAQTTYNDLPPGDYQATIRLENAQMQPVTNGQSSVAFTVATTTQIIDLDIPYEHFLVSPTGTFFFRTLFGGSRSCGVVTRQILGLSRGGTNIVTVTNSGDAVDGTTPSPCHPASDATSQAIRSLAWGPIRITITGLDAADVPVYRGSFDTFSGAGVANPSLEFDVPLRDGGF